MEFHCRDLYQPESLRKLALLEIGLVHSQVAIYTCIYAAASVQPEAREVNTRRTIDYTGESTAANFPQYAQ